MTSLIKLAQRSLLSINGVDASVLLQGLITNDIRYLGRKDAIASFLLNNKGRIVEDLIISKRNDDIIVECSASGRDELKMLLEKYRMRKKASINIESDEVYFSKDQGFEDPRYPWGNRVYGSFNEHSKDIDLYVEERLKNGIPEGKEELSGMLPFQANGDLLNFVSLDKGCYIGQELTARTAHTGVIRRRVIPFKCNSTSAFQAGEQIVDRKNLKVGKVVQRNHKYGLAVLPIDSLKKKQELLLNDVLIETYAPVWMKPCLVKSGPQE
ncbi:unnamed protein product [Auanema sp. JU1783]|nr:unnamed protein product [Auanema sp. JU1783]